MFFHTILIFAPNPNGSWWPNLAPFFATGLLGAHDALSGAYDGLPRGWGSAFYYDESNCWKMTRSVHFQDLINIKYPIITDKLV
jgi:hypothetical protein